jgi:hypothetical protein
MLFFSVGIIAAKLTDNMDDLPSLIFPKSQAQAIKSKRREASYKELLLASYSQC